MTKHTITRRQKDISRLQRERKEQMVLKLKAEKNKKAWLDKKVCK